MSAIPYFSTPEQQKQFAAEVRSWFGTPFIPQAGVKGAGVDCVRAGFASYAASGFAIRQPLPHYSMEGGKHQTESQLIRWIEATGQFGYIGDRSAISQVQCGDTLCFRVYRSLSAHHTGYAIGGTEFGHSLYGRDFRLGDLRDKTFLRWLVAIYRPIMEVAA